MDKRVALYVYEKSKVTIAPEGPIDLFRMGNDYSTELVQSISEPTTLDLTPGVYGYAFASEHGITAPPTGVDLVVDLQKKKPWPMPPPPPPPPYVGRSSTRASSWRRSRSARTTARTPPAADDFGLLPRRRPCENVPEADAGVASPSTCPRRPSPHTPRTPHGRLSHRALRLRDLLDHDRSARSP
jgi:hypothetical protein